MNILTRIKTWLCRGSQELFENAVCIQLPFDSESKEFFIFSDRWPTKVIDTESTTVFVYEDRKIIVTKETVGQVVTSQKITGVL